MARTYAEMTQDIQDYTSYDETSFVAHIPDFIKAAEERIWYYVYLLTFRRNSTGLFNADWEYLQTPSDFLATASLAVIENGEHKYLDVKDVSFIREAYPNRASTGRPRYYAMFDEDTFLVGPTPDQAYNVELHYYYRPPSLVGAAGNTSWLSINAEATLRYGALMEAANYLKRTAGIDAMGEEYEKQFVLGLNGLKKLGEVRVKRDAYRSGQDAVPGTAG